MEFARSSENSAYAVPMNQDRKQPRTLQSLVSGQSQYFAAQSGVMADASAIKGRGATFNPGSRFDSLERSHFDDGWEQSAEEVSAPQTVVHPDRSRSILSEHDSPDLGHGRTLNPYRGCEHGCIYCYARPTHNHFGLSSGLDFETRLFAKHEAAELLRSALAKSSYKPKTILIGGVTDPYQPIERELCITRSVLEVLCETRHPFTVITKSAALVRDLDLFSVAGRNGTGTGAAAISITTLDPVLARKLEPRAHHPEKRLAAVRALSQAGVPTTVMMAPIIPGLNDHEIEPLLKAAAEAGAHSAGYTLLRLPWDLKELFESWLATHFPERKERVLSLIRQTRNGKLYEHSWEWRRRGRGPIAELIGERFALGKRRFGLETTRRNLRTDLFVPPTQDKDQLRLFASDSLDGSLGSSVRHSQGVNEETHTDKNTKTIKAAHRNAPKDTSNETWMGIAEGEKSKFLKGT